jgi:hypothetical protein
VEGYTEESYSHKGAEKERETKTGFIFNVLTPNSERVQLNRKIVVCKSKTS